MVSISVSYAEDRVTGHWEGRIEIPGQPLAVKIDLAADDSDWRGTIDIPAQGAEGLPLSEIRVVEDGEDVRVKFSIRGVPGNPTFDGQLQEGIISGMFNQGGATFGFRLSREVVAAPVRPQEPQPPFPYHIEEVMFQNGDVNLAGTLTVPQGDGPFPAVLLISGSGLQDRDETVFGHKPFWVLADHLSRAGIAVLRVDDPGIGKSTPHPEPPTTAVFATDAEAGVAFLKGDDRIGTVGLIGHSEGGAIAAVVASRNDDIGFVVLMAAPGVLGAELLRKQNGDPRPPMANRIADTLKPYGGTVLVRAFVYGNLRYTPEPYRNLIPYDLFAHEDGNFRDNVVIVPKGSPMDWDLWAPIPALDGAMQKNLSGSELVIDKSWPVSWVKKWKWWFGQDTHRNGPGSLNKFSVDCIMGVAMISPSPAWTESPLNTVNYYGLGRLSWNPDLTVDEIYTEWIQQTFGNDPDILETVKTILMMLEEVTRKSYNYRGYRGIWLDSSDPGMTENKTPYIVSKEGIGVMTPALRARVLAQYAPGLREIYGDPLRGEAHLVTFHFTEHDHGKGNTCITLKRCKNVEVRNLNVHRGGDSAVLAEGCDGLLVDNVDIRTDGNGLYLSECQNVTIAYCRINVVRREYGRPIGGGEAIKVDGETLSSENITVQDCFLVNE